MEDHSVPGQLDLLAFTAPAPGVPDPAPKDRTPEARPNPDASIAAVPAPDAPGTLLIIDTETTGLDPALDHCLEVGAILFDISARQVLAQQPFLLPL